MKDLSMNNPLVFIASGLVLALLVWIGGKLIEPWARTTRWYRRFLVWRIARRTHVDTRYMVQGYQQLLDRWRQSGQRLETLVAEMRRVCERLPGDAGWEAFSTKEIKGFLRAWDEHLQFEQHTLSILERFRVENGVFTHEKVQERIKMINHFRDQAMRELERRKGRDAGR